MKQLLLLHLLQWLMLFLQQLRRQLDLLPGHARSSNWPCWTCWANRPFNNSNKFPFLARFSWLKAAKIATVFLAIFFLLETLFQYSLYKKEKNNVKTLQKQKIAKIKTSFEVLNFIVF